MKGEKLVPALLAAPALTGCAGNLECDGHPMRRGLEAGHGARPDRSALHRWLLVPCWRPQGNVDRAPAETVKTSSRAGHYARGQRHPHHLADTVFSARALPRAADASISAGASLHLIPFRRRAAR